MVWPTLESRTAIRNRTEQNRTFTGCCTVNTRVYFVTNRMEFFCYCFRQCISDRQRDRRTKCTAWNINRKIPSQMFYAAAESFFMQVVYVAYCDFWETDGRTCHRVYSSQHASSVQCWQSLRVTRTVHRGTLTRTAGYVVPRAITDSSSHSRHFTSLPVHCTYRYTGVPSQCCT